MKGRKVAIKYRDKSGNTWAGRGAQPRWLTAAIKAGAKRDDFLSISPSQARQERPQETSCEEIGSSTLCDEEAGPASCM